jgi:hypothetical protein
VLTLLGALLLIPFEMAHGSAQKRRLLSPHELYLRRATQPLGVMAVLVWCFWFFGTPEITQALTPLVFDPAGNWLPLIGIAALLLFGMASFISGVSRCWGMRSDGILPTRAFFKLAIGVIGIVLLRQNQVTIRPGGEIWPALLWFALHMAAVWCIAVGGARLILVTTGGGSALGRVNRHIQQTQVVMRQVRSRPWWQFW